MFKQDLLCLWFHNCPLLWAENVTNAANNYAVAGRRLPSPQLQPSAVNIKPPSIPPIRRSRPTSPICRRLQRHRGVFAWSRSPSHHDKEEKQDQWSQLLYLRPPQYHRRIDDPLHLRSPLMTDFTWRGGSDLSYAGDYPNLPNDAVSHNRH